MKIEDEQAYPIWSITINWSQDGKHDPEYPKRYKDLPEGRIPNGTQYYKMYKEEDADVMKDAKESWEKLKAKEDVINPSEPTYNVKLVRHETWCLTWFQHWTFDTGQTDAEALESFDRFVSRMQNEPECCLMGAEDRWRWTGNGDDGDNHVDTPPPCRCKHCKEQGVIRIGH